MESITMSDAVELVNEIQSLNPVLVAFKPIDKDNKTGQYTRFKLNEFQEFYEQLQDQLHMLIIEIKDYLNEEYGVSYSDTTLILEKFGDSIVQYNTANGDSLITKYEILISNKDKAQSLYKALNMQEKPSNDSIISSN